MAEEVPRFLFVGERRSARAVRLGVCWRDGRLAARPLFAALRALGVAPEAQQFANLFLDEGPRVPLPGVLAAARQAGQAGLTVVALGAKVARHLRRAGVPHVALVHPAARGGIRRRQRYVEHVRSLLAPLLGRSPPT